MIVVDSSVWIANLRNDNTEAVRKLRTIRKAGDILIGDVILLEVLMGVRDDRHAARIERDLRQFEIRSMTNDSLAVSAARNYRRLRAVGITVRKTVDLIVGSYCIEHRHALLHQDRDFEALVRHLGLQVV